MLATAQEQVKQAEEHSASYDASSASKAAKAASASLTTLDTTLERYAALREGLATGHRELETLGAQGYHTERSSEALDALEQLLGRVVAELQAGGAPAAQETLAAAEAALQRSVTYGRMLPETRAANEQRVAATGAAGQQLAAAIMQGRQTFDIVDEFAPSTWRDIAGNGSEAQAAADRAHMLWQRAASRNTMEAQEFVAAQADLDGADAEVRQARGLLDAIAQRLKDLEQARSIAKQELRAAAEDIRVGWLYVQQNDPDVGKVPEEQLRQAEALLAKAQAEEGAPKPDWLELVKQAQAANAAADEALGGARGEVEAMNKLREQLANAQQLAQAEVRKVLSFAEIHRADFAPETWSGIEQLQGATQETYNLVQTIDQSEEEGRRAAIEQALQGYRKLQERAEKRFAQAEHDFAQAEAIRQQAAETLDPAREALASAQRSVDRYESVMQRSERREATELLQRAEAALSGLGTISSKRDLPQARKVAQAVQEYAGEAERIAERAYERDQRNRPSGGSGPIVIVGGFGGGFGGGSGGGGSSGWGGSGGGGGGGWGGGGGGGGDWGGGGGGGDGW